VIRNGTRRIGGQYVEGKRREFCANGLVVALTHPMGASNSTEAKPGDPDYGALHSGSDYGFRMAATKQAIRPESSG